MSQYRDCYQWEGVGAATLLPWVCTLVKMVARRILLFMLQVSAGCPAPVTLRGGLLRGLGQAGFVVQMHRGADWMVVNIWRVGGAPSVGPVVEDLVA